MCFKGCKSLVLISCSEVFNLTFLEGKKLFWENMNVAVNQFNASHKLYVCSLEELDFMMKKDEDDLLINPPSKRCICG